MTPLERLRVFGDTVGEQRIVSVMESFLPRVRLIMLYVEITLNEWIDQCAAKGFNAIEPDNLDVCSAHAAAIVPL